MASSADSVAPPPRDGRQTGCCRLWVSISSADPMEGLMSVAAGHQLESQRGGAGRRQGARTGRQPKKWTASVCQPASGPRAACGSGVQARTPRSQHSPENAARERSRVRNLRQAFHSLQAALPAVPPDTKLSKLDVLVLATNYIAHLTETLDRGGPAGEHSLQSRPGGYLHPVKKWPMRSLLYCGAVGELLSVPANHALPPGQEERGVDGTRE